jgi:Rho guanine nucleotide exchange factor 4
LLRELIKFTPPEHPDYPHLEEALIKINQVVNLVNERTRMVGDREKLQEIQTKIEFSPPFDLLSQPGRRLLKESPILKVVGGKAKDRTIFLFNDIFILCKTAILNKGRYQFESTTEIGKCSVSATVNSKSTGATISSKLIKTMFEVVSEKETFLFNCLNEIEKAKWVSLFDETIKAETSSPLKNWALNNPVTSSSLKSPDINAGLKPDLKKNNTVALKKRPSIFVMNIYLILGT